MVITETRRRFQVTPDQGLHLRLASRLAHLASYFESEVTGVGRRQGQGPWDTPSPDSSRTDRLESPDRRPAAWPPGAAGEGSGCPCRPRASGGFDRGQLGKPFAGLRLVPRLVVGHRQEDGGEEVLDNGCTVCRGDPLVDPVDRFAVSARTIEYRAQCFQIGVPHLVIGTQLGQQGLHPLPGLSVVADAARRESTVRWPASVG